MQASLHTCLSYLTGETGTEACDRCREQHDEGQGGGGAHQGCTEKYISCVKENRRS